MSSTTSCKTSGRASNVYLFKNGYGVIVKTFEFPPNKDGQDQCLELFDPPSNPIHGTFWIQPVSNKTSISSIRTKKTSTFVDKDCLTVEDLLQGNVGKNVDLLVADTATRTKEWISGTIKSIKRNHNEISDDDTDETKDSTASSAFVTDIYGQPRCISSSALRSSPFQSGNLLLLTTADDDLLALPLSDVKSIRSKKDSPLNTNYSRKVKKNCLLINYKNQSGTNEPGLMKYLTSGLTWAPSYDLVLLKSNDPSVKKLHFSSKAVILNDSETLDVENLYCIVGFPNVSKFASVIDPMISGTTVQEFLNQLNTSESAQTHAFGRGNRSVLSNSIMTQQMLPSAAYNPTNVVPTNENQQDANVDDLHVYEFRNISLEKKGRLMLPIFDIELDYKDVYHCKINNQSAHKYYAYQQVQDTDTQQEVWHSIEFDNLSNFVWTTAPAVVAKGKDEQQFLAQDTLTYTSKGSTTFVKLTKALEIRVAHTEKVTSTDSRRLTFFQLHYQTDHIEGRINIVNLKSEKIILVLSLSTEGKLSNYSIQPKKDIIKSDNNVVNQHHEIQWEINVQPKTVLELVYTRAFNKRV